MDLSNWKALLLDWLFNTKLIKKYDTLTIDDTNLEEFFSDYKSILKISDKSLDLVTFLKFNYPDFELHFFIDNELCRGDYVLFYSILLHYGCVSCCNVALQKASQDLNTTYQMAVTVFLNHLITKNVPITRVTLRDGILESINVILRSPEWFGSPATEPVTPRTVRLDENNKEIFRLRNQIESDQFEINYLENQLKDREDKIMKLEHQHGGYVEQIKELKSKILYGDEESKLDGMNCSERLEIKMLRKNNSMLEDKIANLLIELNCLSDEKSKMTSKLKMISSELKTYKGKTEELGQLVEEYNADVISKNQQISDLVETNMELEAFITENKSLLNKNIDTINSSAVSFLNLSSSSIKSTNLGSCVIDIQLKEKELENQKLKSDLGKIKQELQGFKEKLVSILRQTLKDHDELRIVLEAENVLEVDSTLATLFESISNVKTDNNHLKLHIRNQQKSLEKCKKDRESYSQEIDRMTSENGKIKAELDELRATIRLHAENENRNLESLKQELKNLDELNSALKLEKDSFRNSLDKSEESLFKKMKRIEKLLHQIENLKFENKKLENELKVTQEHVQTTISELKREQLNLEERLQEFGTENDHLKSALNRITKIKEDTEKRINEKVTEIVNLESENSVLSEQLKTLRHTNQIQIEKLKQELNKEQLICKDLKNANEKLTENMKVIELKLENYRPGNGDVETSKLEIIPFSQSSRRSSLKNQLTSTPRLSMKQKVKLHNDLLRKRRISFLTNGLASSESDERPQSPGVESPRRSLNCSKIVKRNSIDLKLKSNKTAVDRNMINKIRKLRRQSTYNKSRTTLTIVESPQSFTWDNNYDFGCPESDGFNPVNTDTQQNEFENILQMKFCDIPDFFKPADQTHVIQAQEISVENGPAVASNETLDSSQRTSFNKTHSINSGVFMIDKIPQTNVLHFSPVTVPDNNFIPDRNLRTVFIPYVPLLFSHYVLIGMVALIAYYYISNLF